MPTLTDDEFLHEVDALITGRDNQLVTPAKEEPAAPAPAPETPPVAETPPTEPPVTPNQPFPEPETPPEPASTEAAPESAEPAGETPPTGETVPESPTATEPNYKEAYERLFGAPIRAGGQDITLANVDEAVSLIQKGVGFHNKLNKLQGQLKYVEMLRNNDLLDENRLSLLIDAHKKNPGAIKKLLDESKIDPLTLDSAEASSYAPSDHRVTDEQVRFQSTINDLTDSPHGTAILQDARGWDQASKAEIYKTPEVLGFLAHQKELGRYDQIKSAVERQKMMGNIPANESFLLAYTRIGQQMMQAGVFGKSPKAPTPTPVAQKVITPSSPANAQKAAAAAPTRGSAPTAKAVVNTKDMPDEEFEKFFKKIYSV